MDALSDVLRAVRLSGAFFFDVHARGPGWRKLRSGKSVVGRDVSRHGSDHLICYHAIMEGTCWCSLEGEAADQARGRRHRACCRTAIRMCSPPRSACASPPDMSMYRQPEDGRLPSRISVGTGDGAPAHFVCGFLACDSRPYNPLLTALPRVIRVSDHGSGALGAYFRAALAESKGRMGGECMLGASANSCSSTWCGVISSRCRRDA